MPTLSINVVNLSKSYKSQTVINKINFKVLKGEIFGILGPNDSYHRKNRDFPTGRKR